MRKLVGMFVVLVGMVPFLIGCGSTQLSEIYDADTVEAQAKTLIDNLNSGSYDAVVDCFTDDMKAALPAETLEKSVGDYIAQAGAFSEYSAASVVGTHDKKSDQDLAVAVVVAKCADKSLTYTVSFNPDMQVSGLYVK